MTAPLRAALPSWQHREQRMLEAVASDIETGRPLRAAVAVQSPGYRGLVVEAER